MLARQSLVDLQGFSLEHATSLEGLFGVRFLGGRGAELHVRDRVVDEGAGLLEVHASSSIVGGGGGEDGCLLSTAAYHTVSDRCSPVFSPCCRSRHTMCSVTARAIRAG